MGEAKRRKLAGEGPRERAFHLDVVKAKRDLIYAGKVGRHTTPVQPFNRHVIDLCKRLNPNAEPVYLSLTPVAADPPYRNANCHCNVKHYVREHGGTRVNGWTICANSEFAEAEFHSVARTDDGRLIDVTPMRPGETQVLFLPDPDRKIRAEGPGDYIGWTNQTTLRNCPYMLFNEPHDMPIFAGLYDADTKATLSAYGLKNGCDD